LGGEQQEHEQGGGGATTIACAQFLISARPSSDFDEHGTGMPAHARQVATRARGDDEACAPGMARYVQQ
jgi:hypothetical protein